MGSRYNFDARDFAKQVTQPIREAASGIDRTILTSLWRHERSRTSDHHSCIVLRPIIMSKMYVNSTARHDFPSSNLPRYALPGSIRFRLRRMKTISAWFWQFMTH